MDFIRRECLYRVDVTWGLGMFWCFTCPLTSVKAPHVVQRNSDTRLVINGHVMISSLVLG